MKNLKLIIFLLFVNNIFAQFQGVVIEYREYFDTDRPIERKATLYTTAATSIYEQDYGSSKQVKPTPAPDTNVVRQTFKPLVNDNVFFKIDRTTNKLETFGYLVVEKKSKIIDDLNIKWQLLSEKKVIDDIECYKATTNFRGRKWEAWYAPSLPYPAGPYKFGGLPGLIINLSDETKKYNFAVTKIEFLKEELYQNKFDFFKNIPYDQIQSLKEFTIEREKIISEFFESEIRERGSERTREKQDRKGIELIYEWEEEPKK
ncbi:MAG TPA: GLPGLI family protein [Xanthomarina sp.]|nr:GLPGLI family protein [Xanthomarina sp.]